MSTIEQPPLKKSLSITCQQGQAFLIGQEIRLTVKAIYKRADDKRCVQLSIDLPKELSVFQERLMEMVTSANVIDSHQAANIAYVNGKFIESELRKIEPVHNQDLFEANDSGEERE